MRSQSVRRTNMLVVLLLISQVTCDWVEISQNHYRKEPPRRAMQQPINNHDEEKPKDNRVYRNNSMIEKQWNKATIDRVTNIGNIRRVQELSVKTPSVKLRPNTNDYAKLSDNTDVNNKRRDPEHFLIHKPFHEEEIFLNGDEDTQKEIMTKLYDPEPVKRLQVITNGDVKNSGIFLQNPSNRRKISIDDGKQIPNQDSDENRIYKEQGSRKNGIVSGATSYQDSDLDDRDYNRHFQRLLTTGQNPGAHNVRIKSNFISTTPIAKTTKIVAMFDKDNLKHFQKIENFDDEEDLSKTSMSDDFKYSNTSITNKPKFHVTKLDKIHIQNTDTKISKLDLPSFPNLKTSPRIDITNIPERSIIHENVKETKEKNEDVNDRFEEISNATKKETMSAMWKLVQIVSDTIYKNTHRSFKSKVKYLEGLKATILSTIEEQFERLWPDDMEHRGSARRARSAEARGHVEFPSSESTLMTISFLTFAVFLIKLVLQLIHTYKSKTMMVTPAVVAAVGRAAAALRSKH